MEKKHWNQRSHIVFDTTKQQLLALVYGQLDDIDFLKKLVQSRKAIATVAKWAHAVLKIFYAVPVYRGG